MILSGRKLIESTSKKLSKLNPIKGIEFWKSEVVAYIEKRDINSFSIDDNELVSIIETEFKDNSLSIAVKNEESRRESEVRDYSIDFQSYVAEKKWRSQ